MFFGLIWSNLVEFGLRAPKKVNLPARPLPEWGRGGSRGFQPIGINLTRAAPRKSSGNPAFLSNSVEFADLKIAESGRKPLRLMLMA